MRKSAFAGGGSGAGSVPRFDDFSSGGKGDKAQWVGEIVRLGFRSDDMEFMPIKERVAAIPSNARRSTSQQGRISSTGDDNGDVEEEEYYKRRKNELRNFRETK